jgi:hypothetical protein
MDGDIDAAAQCFRDQGAIDEGVPPEPTPEPQPEPDPKPAAAAAPDSASLEEAKGSLFAGAAQPTAAPDSADADTALEEAKGSLFAGAAQPTAAAAPGSGGADAALEEAKGSLFAGAAQPADAAAPGSGGADAALEEAKGSLFAGAAQPAAAAAPGSGGADAALEEAKGSLFAGAAQPAAAAAPGSGGADAALEEAKGSLFAGASRGAAPTSAPHTTRSLEDMDDGDLTLFTGDSDEEQSQPEPGTQAEAVTRLGMGGVQQEKGKTYYQIYWTEQSSSERYIVWRRYSEFEELRKRVCKLKPAGKELKLLPFPAKTRTKVKANGRSEGIVDSRKENLATWLHDAGKLVAPSAEGSDGQKLFYDFLSGGSDPDFHKAMTLASTSGD